MATTKNSPKRSRYDYEEDLFKETTMTFGEHLEELRSALFKAIVGLVIGFVGGLFFGNMVVEFISRPLTSALESYYQRESEDRIAARLDELKQAGYHLPGDPDALKKFMAERKLIFDEVFVNPDELTLILRQAAPGRLREEEAAPPDAAPEAETADQPDQPAADEQENLQRVFLWRPISEDLRVRPKALNAHEAFIIYIKASLLLGALVASPWIFYQIWSFVAAGLYPHERRYIHVFLPFSLGLFLAGAALAFFFVFEPVLDFLFSFNRRMGIDPDPRISEWLNFVLVLPLGFGIAFQLPLVMLFLERIGIFDVEAYLSKWRVSLLVIAIISMFLTPADPYSMILMAAPLTVLYFGGIVLCKFMPRGKSPFDEFDD